ncbi:cyclopropane-fatty-acyl-phospholipid synthase family protein [soil metagenome]
MMSNLRLKVEDRVKTSTRPLTLAQKIWRRVVLTALGAMTEGRLKLILPEGEVIFFGKAEPRDPKICAEIEVLSEAFFRRVVVYGHIGLSESYMDGHWQTNDVASVIAWALLNISQCPLLEGNGKKFQIVNLLGLGNQLLHLLRHNNESNSRKNISYHYDLSNELFKLFLDQSMTYSCAYFKDWSLTLGEAQAAKYENLCRKLALKENDRVLEIGCGWGGFAEYAASNYGCHITAVTISQEQFDYAKARIEKSGLGGKVDLRLQDYRKITGQFDKIVSIEMIEAVGHEYLDIFFKQCDSLLAKDGLLALQMITCPDSRYDLLRENTDFIQKHIFPGSLLLSHRRVAAALKNCQSELFVHALEDMGNDYAKTLGLWQERFEAQLPALEALGFDQIFVRKWRYYLAYCFAAFAMRNISVVQTIYTRPNNLNLSRPELLNRFA